MLFYLVKPKIERKLLQTNQTLQIAENQNGIYALLCCRAIYLILSIFL